MSDSSFQLFYTKQPVLFHMNLDKPKRPARSRLVSASGRLIGTAKPRPHRKDDFRLEPREVKFSQIIAVKLIDHGASDSPGLAFAISLEADRLKTEFRFLASTAKRQSFIKAVIDEIGSRTKQRDAQSIYTDVAIKRISRHLPSVEKQRAPAPALDQEPSQPSQPEDDSSSSSESECSFRIVRHHRPIVQKFAIRQIFSEWSLDFKTNNIDNEEACLNYFLKPEKGQIKTLYIAIHKDCNTDVHVIGTVGISTKEFSLHISNLLILNEWRHMGFGKKLMRFAENRCQTLGLSTANLWCAEELVRMYVDERSLDDRCNEALRVLKKYPGRIPCIVEQGSKRAPPINKRKYLVPRDIPFSQFHMVVRQQIDIKADKAIFMFIDGKVLPTGSTTVGEVYDLYKNPEDSLLSVTYDLESTFG